MAYTPLPIPTVSKLLATCWTDAETELQKFISGFPDQNEEFITTYFRHVLSEEFSKRNARGQFVSAFTSDLSAAFSGMVQQDRLMNLACGIKATVVAHPREAEAKTGGDLGIVVVRPNIEYLHHCRKLRVDRGYERGLLCQAKLRSRSRNGRPPKWPSFSDTQKTVLPDRLGFLALLLYEYDDEERAIFTPFKWQLCHEHDFPQVAAFLRKDAFPTLKSSSEVIQGLGAGVVGTDDLPTIREVIAPPIRRTMTIKIGWDDGEGPAGMVQTESRRVQHAEPLRELA